MTIEPGYWVKVRDQLHAKRNVARASSPCSSIFLHGLKARATAFILILLITSVFTIGCDKNKYVRQPYYGPTLPLTDVILQINQQNSQITSLRCEGTFSTTLIDPQTRQSDSFTGDLTLLYMPQRNLKLVGKKIGTTVFEIGSNQDRYWLTVPEKARTMWWGNHQLTGSRVGRVLPVRPDLLAEVLSVQSIDSDLLKEPVPTIRFNNDQDCYMLTWSVLLPDRWVIQKEVWYDRQTLSPRLVNLFDDNGRIILSAYLLKPETVDGYDPAVKIASVYKIFFPESGSQFDIKLDILAKSQRGVPRLASFNFPEVDNEKIQKVIQVDE